MQFSSLKIRLRIHATGNKCPYGKTYFNLFASASWVQYHHILFSANSTADINYVNLDMLKLALDAMMHGCAGRGPNDPPTDSCA